MPQDKDATYKDIHARFGAMLFDKTANTVPVEDQKSRPKPRLCIALGIAKAWIMKQCRRLIG